MFTTKRDKKMEAPQLQEQKTQFYQDQYGNIDENHPYEEGPEINIPIQQKKAEKDVPYFETNEFKNKVSLIKSRKGNDGIQNEYGINDYRDNEREKLNLGKEFRDGDIKACLKVANELMSTNSIFSNDSKEYRALNKANEKLIKRLQEMQEKKHTPTPEEIEALIEPVMDAAEAYRDTHDMYDPNLSKRQKARLAAIAKIDSLYSFKRLGKHGEPQQKERYPEFWKSDAFKANSNTNFGMIPEKDKVNKLSVTSEGMGAQFAKMAKKSSLTDKRYYMDEEGNGSFVYADEMKKLSNKCNHMAKDNHKIHHGEILTMMNPLKDNIEKHHKSYDEYRLKNEAMTKEAYKTIREMNEYLDMYEHFRLGNNQGSWDHNMRRLAGRLNDITSYTLMKRDNNLIEKQHENLLNPKMRKENISKIMSSDTFKRKITNEFLRKADDMTDAEFLKAFNKLV